MKIEEEHIKCLTNNRGVFIQFIKDFLNGFYEKKLSFGHFIYDALCS